MHVLAILSRTDNFHINLHSYTLLLIVHLLSMKYSQSFVLMVVGNAYQFILDYHFINQNLNIVMSMKLICIIQVSCVFLCVLTYIIGTVQLNLNLMKTCL